MGICLRSLIVVLVASKIFVCSVPLSAQTPITEAKVDSSTIPEEVQDGDGNPVPVNVPDLPLDFFNDFAWRSFIALNWPAVNGKRGVADTTKTVGQPGRRVWETWKAGYEIVQPNGDAPSHWESLDAKTPCPGIVPANSALERIIGTFSHQGFGDFNQVGFGVGSEIGPLICQNNTYTRYEVRVNKQEFDFIRDHRIYLRSELTKRAASQLPLRFPNGSIEVKAAWRELKSSDDPTFVNTFYAIDAKVFNPVTGTCETKRLGLAGFHIVHKTPLRPQWVWSSFEHVSNVPKHGVPPTAGAKFSFNDGVVANQHTDAAKPPISASNQPQAQPAPTQVIREVKLHPPSGLNVGTEAMNTRYQTKLAGTVWANYMLVVTQWPTKTHDLAVEPPDNIDGDPFPAPFQSPGAPNSVSVSNTVIESFVQGDSCMACHSVARGSQLDFVFFLDFHAFDDTGLAGVRPAVGDKLRKHIQAIMNRKSVE